MFSKHNDFEIIHEIREGNHEALSLMFTKYKPLISKKIYHFNLVYDYDDMMQEGYMILHRSILKYDDRQRKTFTKYFEMNLHRSFITIVTKRVRRSEIFKQNEWFLYENISKSASNSVYYELYIKEIAKVLTKQEYLVYTLRELRNYSISFIAKECEMKDKTIYNSLHRAKQKIKAHFAN